MIFDVFLCGFAGGLVAYSHTSTNITYKDCSNSGNITSMTGSSVAGGLAGTGGKTNKTVTFDNCSNSGHIKGLRNAGGLIGSVGNNNGQAAPIVLKNSISNTGKVEAGLHAGGILCSRTAAGFGTGVYGSLTIDSTATFVMTGEVAVAEGGIKGLYWVFQYKDEKSVNPEDAGYYYCDSAITTGTFGGKVY